MHHYYNECTMYPAAVAIPTHWVAWGYLKWSYLPKPYSTHGHGYVFGRVSPRIWVWICSPWVRVQIFIFILIIFSHFHYLNWCFSWFLSFQWHITCRWHPDQLDPPSHDDHTASTMATTTMTRDGIRETRAEVWFLRCIVWVFFFFPFTF